MNAVTTGRLHRVLVGSVLAVALLAGCGGSDEPDGLAATDAPATDAAETDTPDAPVDEPAETQPAETQPAETEAAEESTPEDEPEPVSAGGQTHMFDEIGLTIHEPDEVPEDAAFALDMYVTFAREWRWSLQEVEISDEIGSMGAPSDLRRLERSIDYQEENGIHYGGELTVTLDFEDASEHMVLFTGCLDAADYYWADDDGRNFVRGESGNETASVVVTVTNSGGIWTVSEDADLEDPC